MKKKLLISLVLFVLFLFFGTGVAMAGTVILGWKPPTTDVSGTILTNLAGYKIYWGTSSRNYTNSVNVPICNGCPSPIGTEDEYHCLAQFQPGVTYYFAATAYNTSGAESGYSNEVSRTMPPATCPEGNVTSYPSISANRVDGYDLIFFSKRFGLGMAGAYCTPANFPKWDLNAEKCDLNYDGRVDGYDQNILSSNFGKYCQ